MEIEYSQEHFEVFGKFLANLCAVCHKQSQPSEIQATEILIYSSYTSLDFSLVSITNIMLMSVIVKTV